MSEETNQQKQAILNAMLSLMGEASRTPVLRRPSDYGMEYEDVFFPALDGTVIEGWFIRGRSDRIVICNHFKGANRYGFPGHLEPWSVGGPGFEINMLPLYKALHDAGYSILTYDLRGNGLSAPGPHPIIGAGLVEYRDVIGSLRYVRSREDTKHTRISRYCQCYGAVSTFIAIKRHPEEFAGVASMIAVQPISAQAFIDGAVALAGISQSEWETAYERLTSRRTADIDMPDCAKSIKMPSFLVQVRDDTTTKAYDIQAVYDTVPVDDKKLHWIEGTTVRTEAYRHFPNDPAPVIEWFDEHP